MARFSRFLFVAILLWVTASAVSAQAKEDKPATASITGRITANDQPLAGVTVTLTMADPILYNQQGPQRPISAKTDANGRYRLGDIAAGQYLVSPRALAYALPADGMTGRPGRAVNVGDGEQIEGIDFTLVKGGVITGKITDHLDRPLIAQRVNLRRLMTEGRAGSMPFFTSNSFMFETDDRGIYRLYGLPAGRYTLSVGESSGQSAIMSGRSGKYYPLTFYPGVRDEREAKAIEVTEGSEATGIDIKLPPSEKSYEAKGRVIDASTGTPLAGVALAYRLIADNPTMIGAFGLTQERTNAQGEFVIQGLMPGKYTATMQAIETSSDYYSDPITFEIHESDTEGLEIKAYRGATISGVIVIEGTNDPAILKRVVEIGISAYPEMPPSSRSTQMPVFGGGRTTNPDGTFRTTGVRPGKNRISPVFSGMSVPMIVARIERDGVEIPASLEIAAGEQVTGIKVVMIYGASVIRGQVTVVNGTLPPDTQFVVSAVRIDAAVRTGTRPAQVDARGKFVLEGLVPGEYDLILAPFSRAGVNPTLMRRQVRQRVTVGAGETPVTLTFDLGEKKEGQQ